MIETTQTWRIGDCVELMREMPAESVDMIITSPPYWSLRDYQVDGQIGLERTLAEYHRRLLEVTAECMRVLKPTGVMFWNHGDSYGGSWQNYGAREGKQREKNIYSFERHGNPTEIYPASARMPAKCLLMQNERLIIRMIDEQGWILRNRIIWHKSNGMPSSVTDRFSNKYEPVYMLVKQRKYWFDLDAVRKPSLTKNKMYDKSNERCNDGFPNRERFSAGERLKNNPLGKNPGDVWTIPTHPYPESHFATFPPALVEPLVKAACPAEICPACGLARGRIVDIVKIGDEDDSTRNKRPRINNTMREAPEKGWQSEHHTIGWTDCGCDAGFVAGTVLDPFCGSGTVLEVCRRLNRNAIGFELNPDYEPLIRERSMAHTPPLTSYFGGNE